MDITITAAHIPHLNNAYYTKQMFDNMLGSSISWVVNTNESGFRDNPFRGGHGFEICCPFAKSALGSPAPNYMKIGSRICRISEVNYLNSTSCLIVYTVADDYNCLHEMGVISGLATQSFEVGAAGGSSITGACNDTGNTNTADETSAQGGCIFDPVETEIYRNDIYEQGTAVTWNMWTTPKDPNLSWEFDPLEIYETKSGGVFALYQFSDFHSLLSALNATNAPLDLITSINWKKEPKYEYNHTISWGKAGVVSSALKSLNLKVSINGINYTPIQQLSRTGSFSTAKVKLQCVGSLFPEGMIISMRGAWGWGASDINNEEMEFIGSWIIDTQTAVSGTDAVQKFTAIGSAITSTLTSVAGGNVSGAAGGAFNMISATDPKNYSRSFGSDVGLRNSLDEIQRIETLNAGNDRNVVGIGNKLSIVANYLSENDQKRIWRIATTEGIPHAPTQINFSTNGSQDWKRLVVKGDFAVTNEDLSSKLKAGAIIFNQSMQQQLPVNPNWAYLDNYKWTTTPADPTDPDEISIANIAARFALETKAQAEVSNGTQAYITAHDKYAPGMTYKSCDICVATIVRESGVDTKYPLWYCPTQLAYLESSSLWKEIEFSSWNGDPNNLQPGDILICSAHTIIYAGNTAIRNVYKLSGCSVVASSQDEYAPCCLTWYNNAENGYNTYRVFRKI